MKIYTKRGDLGSTQLINSEGTTVPKHHQQIEACGVIDELNSWIGLVANECENNQLVEQLQHIQHILFTIGTLTAVDTQKTTPIHLPEISLDDVTLLEKSIDDMTEQLPPLNNFILPGGTKEVSHIHLTRAVCRRAERSYTTIEKPHYIASAYLNRLSDFLFTLARYKSMQAGCNENIWKTS